MHAYISRRVVFPLQERLKGKPTYEVLAALDKSQWISEGELIALQFERLKQHLTFAYENVTYYRNLFDAHDLRPDRIQDQADLRRVPFLTRETLRDHFESLCSTN